MIFRKQIPAGNPKREKFCFLFPVVFMCTIYRLRI
jgi:hypothetical protein